MMAKVYAFEGLIPVVDRAAFVHPDAVLIGDVVIGPDCYVGPGASLRGDFGRIVLKAGVNVQDNCVLHTFPGRELWLAEQAHISHGSVLHGCRVERNGFVGIQAVVMDDALVGAGALVAAMAFVKAGFQVPECSLVAGVPARVVRPLSPQELAWKTNGAKVYQELARRSLTGLAPVQALAAEEPERPRSRWDEGDSRPLHLNRKHERPAD